MASEFAGRGWSFPVRLDDAGKIAIAGDDAKIRQSIEIILRTAPGERVMHPDFGCGIHNFVFAAIRGDVIGQVLAEVSEALTRWEPRIKVIGLDGRQDDEDPARLLIDVEYEVRSTNSRFNLVFPFYVR